MGSTSAISELRKEPFTSTQRTTKCPSWSPQQLDSIREADGHGTVVIIPAFNNFLENTSLWHMVSQAASANFFAAIEARRAQGHGR